jgi:hypothetical protein
MSDDVLHTALAGDRVQKPNGSISGASLGMNSRSCVTCRKRKVKCDKKQPCSNCTRAKIECIFPGPGRAPRKSRKPPDGELMDRLKRLEGVVLSLNAQVEEHEQENAEREKRENGTSEQSCQGDQRESRPVVATDNSVQGLETRFGRLVVDQGRSRYINNSFWASLNNEVRPRCSVSCGTVLMRRRSKISSRSSSTSPMTKTKTTLPTSAPHPSTRALSSVTARLALTWCPYILHQNERSSFGHYTKRTWILSSRCCISLPSNLCFWMP